MIYTNKKLVLIASATILYLVNISKTQADEILSNIANGTCGATCEWQLTSDGKLKITGSGNMNDYTYDELSPWYEYKNQITSLDVSGIETIGAWAFRNLSELQDVKLSNSTKRIKGSAFYSAFKPESKFNFVLPDSITELDSEAFAHSHITSINIPDSVTVLNSKIFWGFHSRELETITVPDSLTEINDKALGTAGMTIICKGNKASCAHIEKMLKDYINWDGTPRDISSQLSYANETQCESKDYYWSGYSCKNKKNGIICDENFKRIETWCNRIRYTPAEAAKLLNDDNNSVTITFKK